MKNDTQNLIDIANELSVSVEKIENVKQCGDFLIFKVNNTEYASKLTKTGKHRKNSVRKFFSICL